MDKNLVHGTYNTESVQTYLVIMVQIDDISKTELDLLKQVLELKSKIKLKITVFQQFKCIFYSWVRNVIFLLLQSDPFSVFVLNKNLYAWLPSSSPKQPAILFWHFKYKKKMRNYITLI